MTPIITRMSVASLVVSLMLVSFSACEKKKSPAEKVGDKIEDTGDKVEDKIDETN
jgi:hypothetical protein